jgi:hypothetical protein
MPVGIANKDLRCAVGTRLFGGEISADIFEVTFPRIEIIDSQSEVVIFMAWEKWGAKVCDEMQFLICAESEPGARKRKCRARNWFEFQDAVVKLAASFDVRDVNRDVVKFENRHYPRFRSKSIHPRSSGHVCSRWLDGHRVLGFRNQLPQHVWQNPAVLVIINLNRGINATGHRNIFNLAVGAGDSQREILLRL